MPRNAKKPNSALSKSRGAERGREMERLNTPSALDSDDPSDAPRLVRHVSYESAPTNDYPYRKATSVGGSVVDSEVTSNLSEQSDEQSDATFSSHNSTNSNSSRMASAGATVLRVCGHKVKIPFTVWTFLAMLVPIIFLVASTAVALRAADDERSKLNALAPLIKQAGYCLFDLIEERALSAPWVTLGMHPDPADTGNRTLAKARARVTRQCVHDLMTEIKVAAPRFSIYEESVHLHLAFVRDLGLWRERVDKRQTTEPLMRQWYTAVGYERSGLFVRAANQLNEANRPLIGQVHLFDLINWYGILQGIGGTIVMMPDTANYTAIMRAAQAEYRAEFDVKQHVRNTLLHVSEDIMQDEVNAWVATPEARLMLNLTNLSPTPYGTGLSLSTNGSIWWTALWDAMQTLKDRQTSQLEAVLEGSVDTLVFNAIFMAVGIGVCLGAAALLAFQQLKVRDGLVKQVATIEKTKAAVSAFVPRFTLNKMGYTSITQVRVGESTNVALAMLFSDIRGFTTVSEGMSSEELFEWVQSYFQRVTSIVESRRGNVNEFIGDALFAVFSTCYDGLECAVDMQADVQKLNVERLCCEEDSLPLAVGVGLHHDVVALGILGDSTRHTCTTISASVNVASRLEGLTKHFGCNILVSQAVVDQLSVAEAETLRFRRLGRVQAKGTDGGLPIVEVFQTDDRALQTHKVATRTATERVIDAALHGSIPEDFLQRIHAVAAEYKHDPNVKLGSGLISAAATASHGGRSAAHLGSCDAEMEEILKSLRELEVRDLPLEAVLHFGLGAGAVSFEARAAT